MGLEGNGGGPLYQQLRQELFARIRRGDYAPGDLLPSENQLCEEYGVSLTTARRALLELVKEGLVRRRIGVGTMVAPRIRAAHLAFVSIDYFGDAWRQISSAMGELVAGIGELAWQRNASFSMSGVEEDRAEEHLRALVAARDADGVLLRTTNDIREEHLAILENAGIPYVVIKRQLLGRPMNCVVSNDFLGSQIATTHLLQRGHRRIAFVCAKPALTFTQDRMAGYRDALATAGIAYDEHLVAIESSFSDDMGYRAVCNLLQSTQRPTAIFVASDTMAVGGYRAAIALGLSIPEDVAFVGYDDIAPAALLQPPLTTVRTSYYDFGRKATELLLDIIDGQTTAPQRVVITPELIVRASTGVPTAALRPLDVPQRVLAASDTATMVLIGREGPFVGEFTTALADTGITLLTPAWRALDDGATAAVICVVDVRRDIQEMLAALVDDGEASARALAKQHGGALVLVALGPAKQQTSYLAAAVSAGLEHLTDLLATRWASRGVRINALLTTSADIRLVIGPCQFLLAEASSSLTGQVLYIHAPD